MQSIANMSLAQASDWNYWFFSGVSSETFSLVKLLGSHVISSVGVGADSAIQQKINTIATEIYSQTTIGDKNSLAEVALVHLIGPCFVHWGFSKLMSGNMASIYRSISILFKGIVTGKLIYKANLSSLPGCKQGNGCQASATYMRQYTYGGLIRDVGMAALCTGFWLSWWYINKLGIEQAIFKTNSISSPDNKENMEWASSILTKLTLAQVAYPILKKVGAIAMALKERYNSLTPQVSEEPTYTDELIAKVSADIEKAHEQMKLKREQPEVDDVA